MNPSVLIDLRGRALSITTETATESISTEATLRHSSSKLKPLHHGNTPCQSCDYFYSSVAANLSIVHSPSDGTPGSRQIRSDALADAVSGLQNLLKLSSSGCRPGGDIGMVSLLLLQDVYAIHLQSTDVQRTQRNLRRSAYDLRPIFNHLYDPALTLISIGHRRCWAYDLSLKPGSLVEHHLQTNGFTLDTLFATQSLRGLVFTYRNLEYYHRDSYKLSIHDLSLIKTLSELSEVEIGSVSYTHLTLPTKRIV